MAVTGFSMFVSPKIELIAIGLSIKVDTVTSEAAIRLAWPLMDISTLNSESLPESVSAMFKAALSVKLASTEFKSLIALSDVKGYLLLI